MKKKPAIRRQSSAVSRPCKFCGGPLKKSAKYGLCTRNPTCLKAYRRAQQAAYRAAHPEKVHARYAAYRAAHRKEISARQSAWYVENREEIRARKAARRAARRDER